MKNENEKFFSSIYKLNEIKLHEQAQQRSGVNEFDDDARVQLIKRRR